MIRICSPRLNRDSLRFRAKILAALEKSLASQIRKAKNRAMETPIPEPMPTPRDQPTTEDVCRTGLCSQCQQRIARRAFNGEALCERCYRVIVIAGGTG
jgi:hypothetical protein